MIKHTAFAMLLLAVWTSSVAAVCPAGWHGPAKQLPASPPPWSLTTPKGEQITLTYAERPNNKFCNSYGPTVAVRASLWMYRDNTCYLCQEEAVCQIWAPGGDGNYQNDCSATIKGSRWTMLTNIPGDESSQGWGPDPYSHWHYKCCCAKHCVVNKFYSAKHDFPSWLGGPVDSNIAKKIGPNTYQYIIIIPKNAS